jgi:hypothetical protein
MPGFRIKSRCAAGLNATNVLETQNRDPEQGHISSSNGGHVLYMCVSLLSNLVDRVAQDRPSPGLG